MATYKNKRVRHKRKAVQELEPSVVRESKRVKVLHDKSGDMRLRFVMFPVGVRYNKDIQDLRRGDVIEFLDGSEHYVFRVSRLPIRSAIADSLCWMRYGFGISKAVDIWKDRLRVRKEDVRIMSEDECLIVFFDKEDVRYE